MLKPHHRTLPQPPNMQQSFRNLLHRNKKLLNLSRRRFLSAPPRFLPSNLIRSSHHRLFSSGDPSEEDGSSGYSGSSDLRAWASYDPFADRITTRDGDSNQSRTSRIANDSEEDSSEGEEEKPREWAFDNRAAAGEEDDALTKEPSRTGKSPNEKGKQKGLMRRFKKSGEDPSLGGPSSQAWSSVVRRKTGKTKVSWVCENCGVATGQWWGTCLSCQTPGSVKQFLEADVSRARGAEVSEAAVRSWLHQRPGRQVPQRLTEVNKGMNQSEWRIPLSGHFGMEVARVLGGGIVPGSLVLVGGDPGVGKSTLLLQVAAIISQGHGFKGPAPVIYVSGEESIEQIGNRADRMRITTPDLFLYSSTDIEDILDKIQGISPQALIVDSIQTVYLRGVTGSAGNIMQVKECTSALLRFAKQTNIPVILIGHVTKTGDIAGPRMLEHIVDTVLYMEGERFSSYRLLRSVKNRFGSTDELGVFEMSESGLQAVANPSEMFISERYSDSDILAGLAVAVIIDGSRAFVIEIQALCASGSPVGRQVNGVPASRADMIISVLMKQAGLKLQDNSIFLNVVSGIKLTETAGDLAIAAAICSSFLEFPIPNDIAFIGEIGLGGELRAVVRMDKRVIAVAKLGYKKCIIPKSAEKLLASLNLDIEILGCRTMKEVINIVFRES